MAPDLSGSSATLTESALVQQRAAVVMLIGQMLAVSPDQELPQMEPSPGAPAGGRAEAVGDPKLLPDSTPSPSGPPESPAAPVACWLLAAGLEHIDQVLMHPVDRPLETMGGPIPPHGATHNAPSPPVRHHHHCRLAWCLSGPARCPLLEGYQRQWVHLPRRRVHPTRTICPGAPHGAATCGSGRPHPGARNALRRGRG